MAGNPYDTTDPNVRKLWASKVWTNARAKSILLNPKYGFVGEGEQSYQDKAITLLRDFEKGPGDTLTISLMQDAYGDDGTVGTQQIVGQEGTHDHTTFSMTVNIQRFGHKKQGVYVDAQRVPFKHGEECAAHNTAKWVTRRDVCLMNHLCGNTFQTDARYTGNNTIQAYDANHIYRIGSGLGSGTDQGVGGSSANILDVHTLDALSDIAESLTPPIRPFYIDGNPYYGIICHDWVISRMRQADTTWYAEMRDALKGGMIKNNPIFGRALGMHNNVLIFRDKMVVRGINSSTGAKVANTRRNVFFGAGALAMAYGVVSKDGDKDHLVWHHLIEDAGMTYNAYAMASWGCKRLTFKDPTGTDRAYGSIVVTSYAADQMAYNIPTGPTGQYYSTYDYGQRDGTS